MHVLRLAVVAGLCLPFAVQSQTSTAEEKYRAAFLAHATEAFRTVFMDSPDAKQMSATERNEFIAKFVKGAADCHMISMREYSAELSGVAYSTVEKNGSYLEAKSAFETAIAREGAAGGKREEDVMKMVQRSVELGMACMEKLAAE